MTFVQISVEELCSCRKHYFSAERQTAWQMPGMDSP